MNFFRALVLSLVTLGLISCQHSDSGPATGPVNKEQLKGNWQLVSVQDASGNTMSTNMIANGTKIQLQVNDDDFTIIFGDANGANTVLKFKYTINGRTFVVDKSSGTTFPDFEIVSVSPNRVVTKFMTNDKGQTPSPILETFDRIPDSQLATNPNIKVHIPQTMTVDYSSVGLDKKEKTGSINAEVEFHPSDTSKVINCVLNGSGTDRHLNVQYSEFIMNGNNFGTDSSKTSLAYFHIPISSFDMSKDTEEIDQTSGPTKGDFVFSISDAPGKAILYGTDGSSCDFHVSRNKTALQVTGDCTGGPSGYYKEATIKLNASCELESF